MGQLPQEQPMFSSTNGLGFVRYTGPISGMSQRKAQYAEARRKRRMKRIETKRSSRLIDN